MKRNWLTKSKAMRSFAPLVALTLPVALASTTRTAAAQEQTQEEAKSDNDTSSEADTNEASSAEKAEAKSEASNTAEATEASTSEAGNSESSSDANTSDASSNDERSAAETSQLQLNGAADDNANRDDESRDEQSRQEQGHDAEQRQAQDRAQRNQEAMQQRAHQSQRNQAQRDRNEYRRNRESRSVMRDSDRRYSEDSREENRDENRRDRENAREDRQDYRSDRRNARDDNQDNRRYSQDERQDVREGLRDSRQDVREELRDDRQDLRQDLREDRRDDRREDRTEQRNARRTVRDLDSLGLVLSTDSDRLTINRLERNSVLNRFGFQQGDVIVSVNDRPVGSRVDFERWLFVDDQDRIPVVVLREGREETVYVVVNELHSHDHVVTGSRSQARSGAYFGVTLDADEEGGALVRSVRPNSPAEHAGIRSGDFITAVENHHVDSAADLTRIIRRFQPGDAVEVELSGDESEIVEVVLGEQPRRAVTAYQESYSIQPETRYSRDRVEVYGSETQYGDFDEGRRVGNYDGDVYDDRYDGGLREGGIIDRDDNGPVRRLIRGRR